MRRAGIILGQSRKFARAARWEGRGDMGSFWPTLIDSQGLEDYFRKRARRRVANDRTVLCAEMDDLHGKVALVTGASRGIGRAVAAALSAAGADVAVNYYSREREALETPALVRKTGRGGILVQADVSKSSEAAAMIDTIERDLGPVQILVNNAGIAIRKSLNEVAEQDWDRVVAVNLKPAFLIIQAVFPGMRKLHWGRIINVSSAAAQTGGITAAPPYVASKAGLWGLSHAYAAQFITDGVTVNTVLTFLPICSCSSLTLEPNRYV